MFLRMARRVFLFFRWEILLRSAGALGRAGGGVAICMACSAALADTTVDFDIRGKLLSAQIDGADARNLYDALDLTPQKEGKDTWVKEFETEDRRFGISCERKVLWERRQMLPLFSCEVAFDHAIRQDLGTRFVETAHSIRVARLENLGDSQRLNDSARFPVQDSALTSRKVFKTSDGKVEIRCDQEATGGQGPRLTSCAAAVSLR
jgi:hypothetical protein